MYKIILIPLFAIIFFNSNAQDSSSKKIPLEKISLKAGVYHTWLQNDGFNTNLITYEANLYYKISQKPNLNIGLGVNSGSIYSYINGDGLRVKEWINRYSVLNLLLRLEGVRSNFEAYFTPFGDYFQNTYYSFGLIYDYALTNDPIHIKTVRFKPLFTTKIGSFLTKGTHSRPLSDSAIEISIGLSLKF